MKLLTLLWVVACTRFGCVRPSDEGFDRAKFAADVSTRPVVQLAEYTPFAWDRVHLFPPYTSAENVKSVIGTAVAFPHADSEGWCLLVFLRDGEVAAAVELERSVADFAPVRQDDAYARGDAVFVVDLRTDGWRQLTKKGRSDR